jgi:hypothetical protein
MLSSCAFVERCCFPSQRASTGPNRCLAVNQGSIKLLLAEAPNRDRELGSWGDSRHCCQLFWGLCLEGLLGHCQLLVSLAGDAAQD